MFVYKVSINWNLYLNIRIRVLSVLLGVFAVLNGKLWATMQTTKTHHAFILDPDRSLILHFNGLHRALSGAQAASDTSVLYI